MKGRLKKIVAMLLTAALTVSGVPAVQMTVNAASAEGNIDLTRQVAAEGTVLMENNGALPVKEGTRVAMFGRAMIDYVRGGGGSGETNVDYSRNILQGMQMKAEEGKVELYQPLVDFYKQKVETEGIKDDAKITVTDEMMQALRTARLESFVMQLPQGLDTEVSDNGSSLSGGQKQRLALARVILADRPVIIFDEATSNIDVESEEAIWESIYELAKQKTVLVISHRLASVKEAKVIYVLNEGQLVESGTHHELMHRGGHYTRMVEKQHQLESMREVSR